MPGPVQDQLLAQTRPNLSWGKTHSVRVWDKTGDVPAHPAPWSPGGQLERCLKGGQLKCVLWCGVNRVTRS